MPSLWPTQPRVSEPKIVEVECPYCGVPRAQDSLVWLDPATGKLSTGHEGMEPSTASAIFLVVTAITTSLSTVLIEGLPVWEGAVAGAVLGILVLAAITARTVRRGVGDVRAHSYHCVICGRDWTWREGTPRPRYRYREKIMEDYERLFGSKAEDAEDKA
jgi:DNA-directed RNA polymerase subunit RPC12/RpoP